ncbi:MAG: hypothetical protein GXN92_01920 [Candidatus Micrarchaeota archaeon]|nr:hypothetical protein [Candidatus Micrarchaeota archaeon]
MFDWVLLVILVILVNFLPGIHANLLAILLAPFFSVEQLAFALGLHFILSILPSILYSVSQEVAAAPLINRLAQKDAYSTTYVFVMSAFIAALAALLFPPDYQALYHFLRPYLFYIVLFIATYHFLSLNGKGIFLLSGLWGYYALHEDRMFSLFSGLFAIPYLLFYKPATLSFSRSSPSLHPSPIITGIILGMFSLLLPGVSPPSVISTLVPIYTNYHFLSYYSAIASTQYILAIDNYLQTNKLRNAYVEYIPSYSAKYFLILGIVVGGFLVFFLLPHLPTIPESARWPLLVLILSTSFLLEGIMGLFSLLISSVIGITAARIGASPSSMLGIIILPTLILLARQLG